MADLAKKIIVIEDDETLASSIAEFLKRKNFDVTVCNKPDVAIGLLGKDLIDFVLVDCLLPQMTGVEFVERSKSQFPHQKFKTILMSGIYTDKEFVQDAISRTSAVSFLKKPFDLNKIEEIILKEGNNVLAEKKSERRGLYELFLLKDKTTREKKSMLDSVKTVRGLDLIYIYELLVATQASGYLSIQLNNEIYGQVGFSKGIIFSVNVKAQSPQLGELLIQSGFVDPTDALPVISQKSETKLGLRLIQNNLISPHNFENALEVQLGLRLSHTLIDQDVQIQFSSAEMDSFGVNLNRSFFDGLLCDWILSKSTSRWIQSIYNSFTNLTIVITNENALAMVRQLPIIGMIDGLEPMLKTPQMSLRKLFEAYDPNQFEILKAIHFLLIKDIIVFESKLNFVNPEEQFALLKKISVELKDKTAYQLIEYLGYKIDEKIDFESFMRSVMNILGEAPAANQAHAAELWKNLKLQFEKAGQIIKDGNIRGSLQQSLRHEEAESKLKVTQMIEEIKQILSMNQYAKAQVRLAEVAKINTTSANFHLLNAWAKLGTIDLTKKQLQLKEIEIEITQVPPEERYDSYYAFVVGFFNKIKGDHVMAKKSLERAIALDSSFMPARRELTSLVSKSNQQTDVFSNVMTGFFKRK